MAFQVSAVNHSPQRVRPPQVSQRKGPARPSSAYEEDQNHTWDLPVRGKDDSDIETQVCGNKTNNTINTPKL